MQQRRPTSLLDKIKMTIGLAVVPVDAVGENTIGDEIEMLDGDGHIQYQKLNHAMLRKYKNPFRILYLWTVQETLEVQALLEAMKSKDDLEERRLKIMRKNKMTNSELDTMRMSKSANFFGGKNGAAIEMPKAHTVNTHKEVVSLVMIHELLASFMALTILPRFRQERIDNYKKIMTQFSKMERMNSKNVIIMWQSIMHFHSEKSE